MGRQARQLIGAVDEDALLREIADAAAALCTRDPLVGAVLRESLTEVGPNRRVVAASSRSREALGEWLGSFGARSPRWASSSASMRFRRHRLLRGSATILQVGGGHSPPHTGGHVHLPGVVWRSNCPEVGAIAQHAEGGIQVAARIVEAGDALPALPEPATSETEPIPEDDLLPQPVWGSRVSEDRRAERGRGGGTQSPSFGNRAIWLDDDGERIRALDPTQPPGERVGYSDVSAVARARTCFCVKVRLSASPSTREHLGESARCASAIQESQASWKSALIERLRARSARDPKAPLCALGVRAAGQVRAWTSPHVIRPQSDGDFERLLGWLGLPVQPHFRARLVAETRGAPSHSGAA